MTADWVDRRQRFACTRSTRSMYEAAASFQTHAISVSGSISRSVLGSLYSSMNSAVLTRLPSAAALTLRSLPTGTFRLFAAARYVRPLTAVLLSQPLVVHPRCVYPSLAAAQRSGLQARAASTETMDQNPLLVVRLNTAQPMLSECHSASYMRSWPSPD